MMKLPIKGGNIVSVVISAISIIGAAAGTYSDLKKTDEIKRLADTVEKLNRKLNKQ